MYSEMAACADLEEEGRTTLKPVLKKEDIKLWAGFNWLGIRPMGTSRRSSLSSKYGQNLEQLSSYQLLNNKPCSKAHYGRRLAHVNKLKIITHTTNSVVLFFFHLLTHQFLRRIIGSLSLSRLDDHHLAAIRYYLFNILAATPFFEGHSIRNLTTRHAVVTRAQLTFILNYFIL
jgi:hypothetical protein